MESLGFFRGSVPNANGHGPGRSRIAFDDLRRRLDDTSADVRQFSDVFVFLGLLHFDEFEDDVGMFLSDLQQALRRS